MLVISQNASQKRCALLSDYRWTFLAGGTIGKLARVVLRNRPTCRRHKGQGVIVNLPGLSSAAESANLQAVLHVSSNAVSLIFKFRNLVNGIRNYHLQ